MQTVYLRKNCPKSFEALIKLYTKPDMSTCIIVVNTFQAKILLLDKRVKSFPFIINTLPSSIGLIPKVARVMPLEYFMKLKKTVPKIKTKSDNHPKNYSKGFTLKVNTTELTKKPINNYTKPNLHMTRTPINNFSVTKRQFPMSRNTFYKPPKKPLIKKQVQSDGGVSITLK
jgi:hypothetical protein